MPDQPFVDGVSSTAPVAPAAPLKQAEPKTPFALKAGLLIGLGIPYVIYLFWCLFLLSSLPAQGGSQTLIAIGVFSTLLAALLFLAMGGLGFMRVSASQAAPNAKLMALVKLGIFVIPGVLLSLATPYMISRAPSLTIGIVSPASTSDLVAPLSISFSVQSAVDALAPSGFVPIQYNWDINGDKKADQQTLVPDLTAGFDNEGIYTVSVSMKAADGTTKTASKRFIISKSVFSVIPLPAIVDRPVVFSLERLFPKPEDVTSVAWDFDGDGTFDEENGGIQASYTYLTTGVRQVSAVVQLANKTQLTYQRSIDVTEAPPLPFPVTLKSQPQILIGTKPFTAMFTIETEEPVYSVQWDFDGEKTDGKNVATHTFERNGTFPVVARVRSQSGTIAEVSTVVKIVDKLDLNDLHFDGTPEVKNNEIKGALPLTLDLTPVTQTPFVQFSWEAPDATEVGSTDTKLQAIFRRAGTYVVTLIAQDLEDHVLRLPLTVKVEPPSSLVTFSMDPELGGIAPLLVKFDASASTIQGEDITGFMWNFGDGSPQETGGAGATHTYQQDGRFTVSVTANTTSGLQLSASKTIVVRPPTLQARILPSRMDGDHPLTVEFKGDPSVGNIEQWIWDFDDGTQNDGKSVEHTFLDARTYNVKLTVTDKAGASASTTVPIKVR